MPQLRTKVFYTHDLPDHWWPQAGSRSVRILRRESSFTEPWTWNSIWATYCVRLAVLRAKLLPLIMIMIMIQWNKFNNVLYSIKLSEVWGFRDREHVLWDMVFWDMTPCSLVNIHPFTRAFRSRTATLVFIIASCSQAIKDTKLCMQRHTKNEKSDNMISRITLILCFYNGFIIACFIKQYWGPRRDSRSRITAQR
jgi:hypothetical protein